MTTKRPVPTVQSVSELVEAMSQPAPRPLPAKATAMVKVPVDPPVRKRAREIA